MQTRGVKRVRADEQLDDQQGSLERQLPQSLRKRARTAPEVAPFCLQLHPGIAESVIRGRLLTLKMNQLRIIGDACQVTGTCKESFAKELAHVMVRERFGQDRCFQHPPLTLAMDVKGESPEPCHLSQLSSALIVLVSQFLNLHEVGALANTSRVNRQVATLRVQGVGALGAVVGPDQSSPCLRRRHHFAFYNHEWKENKHGACVAETDLQSISLDMRGVAMTDLIVDLVKSSGSTLEQLETSAIGRQLKTVESLFPAIDALLGCKRLRELHLNDKCDGYVREAPLRDENGWRLKSSSLESLTCAVSMIPHIALCAPNLRHLRASPISGFVTHLRGDTVELLAQSCPRLETMAVQMEGSGMSHVRDMHCLKTVYAGDWMPWRRTNLECNSDTIETIATDRRAYDRDNEIWGWFKRSFPRLVRVVDVRLPTLVLRQWAEARQFQRQMTDADDKTDASKTVKAEGKQDKQGKDVSDHEVAIVDVDSAQASKQSRVVFTRGTIDQPMGSMPRFGDSFTIDIVRVHSLTSSCTRTAKSNN